MTDTATPRTTPADARQMLDAADARHELSFVVRGRPVAYVRMTRYSKHAPRALRYLVYRTEVTLRAREAGAECWTGAVRVYVQAYVRRRTFDLDNLVKGVLDSLNGVAFADDKQVTILQAAIAVTPKDEALHVTVTRLEKGAAMDAAEGEER